MGCCESSEDAVAPMPDRNAKRVLIVLTSHDKLGDTGKPTGWYLPEAAHPYNVFKEAGYKISWASP